MLETWHWVVVLCLQPQPPKRRYQEGGCDALGQAKSRCWVWPGTNVGGDLGQEQGLGQGDYPSGSGHPVLPSTLCLAWYLEDSGGGLGFCQSLWGQEPRGRKWMPGYQICPPGHLLSNNNSRSPGIQNGRMVWGGRDWQDFPQAGHLGDTARSPDEACLPHITPAVHCALKAVGQTRGGLEKASSGLFTRSREGRCVFPASFSKVR